MMNNFSIGTRADPRQGLAQQVQELQNNPAQFFNKMNINIPQNIISDPNAILQYLLSTGKFTQEQVNNAYQMFYKMKQ